MTSYRRLHPQAKPPTQAHPYQDAGFDLSCLEDFSLEPNERKIVDTGIAIFLDLSTTGLICCRSGLAAKKGITIVNSPGIIDSNYTDSIKVILLNTDNVKHFFNAGDRIAQLVIIECKVHPLFEIAETPLTNGRGTNGLGSSGS